MQDPSCDRLSDIMIKNVDYSDRKTTIDFPVSILTNKRLHQCFVHKCITFHTKMEPDQLPLSLVNIMM